MKSVRHDYLKLYAITDDGPNLIERVRLALEGGATCIQHRAKGASFEAAKADALAIQALCREFGVPFIVNDSLELALAIGADGLHVGQSDTAAREARRALGPDAILGVSAATVAEAVKAEDVTVEHLPEPPRADPVWVNERGVSHVPDEVHKARAAAVNAEKAEELRKRLAAEEAGEAERPEYRIGFYKPPNPDEDEKSTN